MSILKLVDVHKRFGTLHALQGVSMEVQRAEKIVLIGPSGCGKSTLLRCVTGLEFVQQGAIWFEGQLVTHDSRKLRAMRARIGFVFQSFALFPHLTALQNVTLGLRVVKGLARKEADVLALNALARVGLVDKAGSYPLHLSGGQQQRVAIARAIVMNPVLMLFDEVTSALDPELIAGVLGVIRDLADGGMTMLVVTHEMGFARGIANRVVFMKDGQILEEAPPEKLFEDPEHEAVRQFVDSIL